MPAHGRKFGQRSRHERHVHRHRRRAWLSGRRGTTGRPASAGLALVLLAVAIAIPAVRIAGRANGDGARDLVRSPRCPRTTAASGWSTRAWLRPGAVRPRRRLPGHRPRHVHARPGRTARRPGRAPRRPAGRAEHTHPGTAPAKPGRGARRPGGLDAGAATEPATAAPATGAPALVPDAPADATRPDGVVCAGDGEAGKRVQVLYVYETGTASRYSQYLASFRAWAAGVDAIYAASAADTAAPARAVRDHPRLRGGGGRGRGAGRRVGHLQRHSHRAAHARLRPRRPEYLIFADANVYCGIATFTADDRPGPANRGNSGPGYGRADAGCWNPAVAAHELAHTLGAVQNGAPNSSGNGHCVDGYDVMCYQSRQANADGSAQLAAVSRTRCPNRMAVQRLDCGHDDYFHTNPEPGSYLATHWNVADSQFLIGGAGTPATPPRRATRQRRSVSATRTGQTTRATSRPDPPTKLPPPARPPARAPDHPRPVTDPPRPATGRPRPGTDQPDPAQHHRRPDSPTAPPPVRASPARAGRTSETATHRTRTGRTSAGHRPRQAPALARTRRRTHRPPRSPPPRRRPPRRHRRCRG